MLTKLTYACDGVEIYSPFIKDFHAIPAHVILRGELYSIVNIRSGDDESQVIVNCVHIRTSSAQDPPCTRSDLTAVPTTASG